MGDWQNALFFVMFINFPNFLLFIVYNVSQLQDFPINYPAYNVLELAEFFLINSVYNKMSIIAYNLVYKIFLCYMLMSIFLILFFVLTIKLRSLLSTSAFQVFYLQFGAQISSNYLQQLPLQFTLCVPPIPGIQFIEVIYTHRIIYALEI